MTRLLQILVSVVVLVSCSDSDKILTGHDFDHGDWLLVHINYAEKTLELIEDESILEKNSDGIWVTPAADCSGTTCDGFLMLYKDGKLMAEDEYLSRSSIFESPEISGNYQNGIKWTINPIDTSRFKHLWDSLKNENHYPTVWHAQPADKDIIVVYKPETK